jgi:hypothetical protein
LAAKDEAPTPESGFLSEIAFCHKYCSGKDGYIFKWDFMIIGTKVWGPYRGEPHDPSLAYHDFKQWVDEIVAIFESGGTKPLPTCALNFSAEPDGFTNEWCKNPCAPGNFHTFVI